MVWFRENACRDSEAVADMTEAMLEAGLPLEMAVQLVNSAVASEGREEICRLWICAVWICVRAAAGL